MEMSVSSLLLFVIAVPEYLYVFNPGSRLLFDLHFLHCWLSLLCFLFLFPFLISLFRLFKHQPVVVGFFVSQQLVLYHLRTKNFDACGG